MPGPQPVAARAVSRFGAARLPKLFYLSAMAVVYGVPFLIGLLAGLSGGFTPTTLKAAGELIALLYVFALGIFCLFVYHMWASIQGGQARTTPLRAVGFLFIPIFNLYWLFQVWAGFAKDYNAFAARHSPESPRLSEGLCLAFCVLTVLVGILSCAPFVAPLHMILGIPLVGPIVSTIHMILLFLVMSAVCDAVNALPAEGPGDHGQHVDVVFKATMVLCGLLVLAVLALIVYELVRGSALSWDKFGFHFFAASDWDPEHESFGALPFIFGTLVSSLLALFIAVPLSIGVAVFTTEMCPRSLRGPLSFFVELLAAIPSVVYGLWGFLVLAPILAKYVQPFLANNFGWTGLFSGRTLGISMLAAGIILAIMIIPIISSIAREVLLVVPQHQREAALALGATRWEMIRIGVLRNARAGIVGGIILGLGRALGETMAVTMVIGNAPQMKRSLFEFGYTMASVLANEFSEASADMHLSALVEIGLALFLVTIIVNALARLLVWSVTRGQPARGHV